MLNLKDAEMYLRACFGADVPVMLEGDPGVGKTAMILRIAQSLGLPCWILQLGEVQEVDVGGFPVVTTNPDGSRQVDRLPLGPIASATRGGGILFLDDFRTAPPPVQGTALRLLQGKAAGDVRLHPDVRIAMAANPVDQTPGGSPLSPPVRSRMLIAQMRPDVSELAPFFETLGNPSGDPSSVALRDLGADFSATLDRQPDLMELCPPPAAISGEGAWGNPRAWEKALRACASLVAMDIADTSPLFFHTLASGVGESAARAYLAIRKVREQLPSVSEIVADPVAAKLPHNPETYVAILGVLAQVAQRDACAAYVYAERIKADEIAIVITRRLMRYSATMSAKSKHFASAKKAQVKMQGVVAMARSAEI